MTILAGKNIQGENECIDSMRKFLILLKLPGTLKELGIARAQLRELAAAVSGNLLNDPASQETDIVIKIYEKAWEGA